MKVAALLSAILAVALALPAAATTPLSTWGTTITLSNETYVLTADLVDAAQGTSDFGIRIAPGVHDIAIDGSGFLIDGRDTSGPADDDIGIEIVGTAASPIRNVRIHDLRFTDLGNAVYGQDDLCQITVEDSEFALVNDWSAIEFVTLTPGATLQWVTIRENWIHDSAAFPVKLMNHANAGAPTASMSHIYVIGNVIHDNRRSVAHPENWNAAIGFRHGASDLRVWDNVVLTNDGLAGLFIGSDDVAGDVYDEVSIRGNHFGASAGNIRAPSGTVLASGITLHQVTTTSGDFSTWTVSGNYLYGNALRGIDLIPGSGPTPLPTNGNWWGADGTVGGTYANGAANATDPSPLDLPDGAIARPDRALIDRSLADTDGYVGHVVLLNQNGGAPGIRGFDIDYDFGVNLVFERTVEGPFLRRQFPITTFFDVPRIGGSGNERTSSGAILGGAAPLAVGNGALALAVFRAGAEDLAAADDVELDNVQVRDPLNQPLAVAGLDDADRGIDATDPGVTLAVTGGDDCVATPTISFDVAASDNYALEDVLYRLRKVSLAPGCWTPLVLDAAGTSTGPTVVVVPFASGDGQYVFEVRATDDAGNFALGALTITYDTTPPADFAGTTGAVAVPGPGSPAAEEVQVTWNGSFEAGGDLRLRYLPYGGAIGNFAYPEYDDAAPVPGPHFPGPAEGIEINIPDAGAGSVTIPYLIAERSYYYYVIYVIDCAGNPSPGSGASARANALSYYLGDWDPAVTPACAGSPAYASGNGEVNFCDLIGLSATFGTVFPQPAFVNYADIGPTVPGPGVLDLPATDNVIDFEDLILFAINFGNVAPLGGDVVLGEEAPGTVALLAEPATDERSGILTVRLRLAGNGREVKGFEAVLEHAAGLRFAGARPGPALGDGAFFRALERGDRVSVNAAALAGVFRGTGVVAELDYEVGGPATGVAVVAAKIRDAANRELAGAGTTGIDEPAAGGPGAAPPLATVFYAPAPNPASGSALLRFTLERPAAASLRVYDTAGRLVRTVADQPFPAGGSSVAWDGRSDAGDPAPTGIYFVEFTGGQVRAVHKLILVR